LLQQFLRTGPADNRSVSQKDFLVDKAQGHSQAIFDGAHKASTGASPTLRQREGNIITLIITITVRKPFYYLYGILVLTYRLTSKLTSSIWISCVRQLHVLGFPKYTSKLKGGLIVFLMGP